MILKGNVYIFSGKTRYELEADNYWKLKREAYAKYVNIFEKIKNNQKKDIKEVQFENVELKYSAETVINLSNDILDQNIIDSFFRNEGLFRAVKGVDLSFEEKLLFLNQAKEGQYFDQGVPIFKDINIIGNGLTFGELGLIFNKPRTSTVISSEESYFLSLSKDDYYEIFDAQIQDIRTKVTYISQLFSGLSYVTIAKISYGTEEKICTINEKIYEENDEANYFFFIRSGEVRVINFQFFFKHFFQSYLKNLIFTSMT